MSIMWMGGPTNRHHDHQDKWIERSPLHNPLAFWEEAET